MRETQLIVRLFVPGSDEDRLLEVGDGSVQIAPPESDLPQVEEPLGESRVSRDRLAEGLLRTLEISAAEGDESEEVARAQEAGVLRDRPLEERDGALVARKPPLDVAELEKRLGGVGTELERLAVGFLRFGDVILAKKGASEESR